MLVYWRVTVWVKHCLQKIRNWFPRIFRKRRCFFTKNRKRRFHILWKSMFGRWNLYFWMVYLRGAKLYSFRECTVKGSFHTTRPSYRNWWKISTITLYRQITIVVSFTSSPLREGSKFISSISLHKFQSCQKSTPPRSRQDTRPNLGKRRGLNSCCIHK